MSYLEFFFAAFLAGLGFFSAQSVIQTAVNFANVRIAARARRKAIAKAIAEQAKRAPSGDRGISITTLQPPAPGAN